MTDLQKFTAVSVSIARMNKRINATTYSKIIHGIAMGWEVTRIAVWATN